MSIFEPQVYRQLVSTLYAAPTADTLREEEWDARVNSYLLRWNKELRDKAGQQRERAKEMHMDQLFWCASILVYVEFWEQIRAAELPVSVSCG